jgi:hypothetical protein
MGRHSHLCGRRSATSSVITMLRFGLREWLVVAWENLSFAQEAPLSTLVDSVTKQGNPGNHKKFRRPMSKPLPLSCVVGWGLLTPRASAR